jgi:hypothetical protein
MQLDLLNASRVIRFLFAEFGRAGLDAVVGVVNIIGEQGCSAVLLGRDTAVGCVS